MSQKTHSATGIFDKLGRYLLTLPWLELLPDAWRLLRQLAERRPEPRLYEVLRHASRLELLDAAGTRAQFSKRQQVRYQQNDIIAFQDQVWGDGEILLDYRCTPGRVVDRHRPGQKTYLLISLRDVKQRGDVDDFHITWGIRNGFTRDQELWETEVSHPTKELSIEITFPADRPPRQVWFSELTQRRTRRAEDAVRLADGRFTVTWHVARPRLHERYIIRWDW